MSLFRQEAIDAQKQKLHGDVFLANPVSFSLITMVLGGLVALALILLFTGSYVRAERVPGYLTPTGGPVNIQSKQYGTLSALHVQEGDHVQTGDALMSIESTHFTEDGSSIGAHSLETLEKQKASLNNQIALEKRHLSSETARLETDIQAKKRELAMITTQVALQEHLTESNRQSLDRAEKLYEKGHLSKSEIEIERQALLNQQGQEQSKKQEQEQIRAEIIQLKFEKKLLPVQSKSRIVALQSQRLDLRSRETELLGDQAYVVKAPISGRVVSIASSSLGDSIEPGERLLALLPENSRLAATLFVPSRAIGFVEVGQEVRLLYSAFPYQRFGSYPAEIIQVAETILSPEEAETPFQLSEPFYRVTAALERNTLNIGGKMVPLQSGMQLEANLIQERRSFFDWILGPTRAMQART